MTSLFLGAAKYSHLVKYLRIAIIAGVLILTVCAPSVVAAVDVDGFGP